MKKIYLILLLTVTLPSCKAAKMENIKYGELEYTSIAIVTEEYAERVYKRMLDKGEESATALGITDPVKRASHIASLKELKPAVFNDTSITKIEIHPNYFLRHLNIKTKIEEHKYRYIDRKDNFKTCYKKRSDFNTECNKFRKLPTRYTKESDYIIKYYPKERKKILGYRCFKVIATNKRYHYDVEMYVTDQIQLGFNFFYNFPNISDKYFIMSATRKVDKGDVRYFRYNKISLIN